MNRSKNGKKGDSFVVSLGSLHLGWSERRYTDSCEMISGEAYIPISAHYSRQ